MHCTCIVAKKEAPNGSYHGQDDHTSMWHGKSGWQQRRSGWCQRCQSLVLDSGVIAREHLELTARLLLLMPLPRDDCLLLRSRRESTGVSAAGSNMSAELEIFLPQIAMRLDVFRSFIKLRDVQVDVKSMSSGESGMGTCSDG